MTRRSGAWYEYRMSERKNRGLKLIGVPVEPDLHEAIIEMAADQADPVTGKPAPLAAVCRDLLHKAFEKGWDRLVARDLADAGYREGLRRGLAEARGKISEAMKESWR